MPAGAWSAVDRGHQRGISARGSGIDAGDALGREAGDIVRAASLWAGAAEAFATERLALDHRADLITIDVKIADLGIFLDIVADGINAALEAEGQAVTSRVDCLDDLVELIAGKANDVKDCAEILAIQLA